VYDNSVKVEATCISGLVIRPIEIAIASPAATAEVKPPATVMVLVPTSTEQEVIV